MFIFLKYKQILDVSSVYSYQLCYDFCLRFNVVYHDLFSKETIFVAYFDLA